jgi:putative peptidoglycan lipid II flippase
MAISTAAFPRLADLAADERMRELEATVSRALRAILFLTIPAALGLAVLREPVTSLLLERGEFTAADTAVTAAALGWYCLGIVPQAGLEIHSRAFYALGDTRTPVILAVLAMVLNLVLSAALYQSFDHQGLAFAVSAAAWLEWVALYAIFHRRTGAPYVADLRAAALFTTSAAVMAFFLAVGFAPFGEANRAEQALIAMAGGIAGLLVYVAMCGWLQVEELKDAVQHAVRILRRADAREAAEDAT